VSVLDVEVNVELEVEGVSVLLSLVMEVEFKSLERFEIIGVVGMVELLVEDGDPVGEEGGRSSDVEFSSFFRARFFFA